MRMRSKFPVGYLRKLERCVQITTVQICSRSSSNKNFSVRCSNTEPLSTDIEWCVFLDGFVAGAKLYCKGSGRRQWNRSYCRISPTAVRDFSFSSITFTGLASSRLNGFPFYRSHLDDDAYLNTAVANFGEIKVEIWAVKI